MAGFIKLFWIMCAAAFLSGCTQVTDTITRTVLGEDARIADRVVDHLLDRDEAGLRRLADREIAPQFNTAAVSAMFETLPDAAATRHVIVKSSHAVGGENAPTETSPIGSTSSLTWAARPEPPSSRSRSPRSATRSGDW